VALKPVKSSEIGIGTILYFDFVNHLHTVK
jgi:hypothetical protein